MDFDRHPHVTQVCKQRIAIYTLSRRGFDNAALRYVHNVRNPIYIGRFEQYIHTFSRWQGKYVHNPGFRLVGVVRKLDSRPRPLSAISVLDVSRWRFYVYIPRLREYVH